MRPFRPAPTQAGDRRSVASRDDGFTFIETLIALFIFSIIASVTFVVVGQMLSQVNAITDTVSGIQQVGQADQSLIPYLRGVTSFSSATSTSFAATSDIGFNTSTGTTNSDALTATVTSGTKDSTIQVSVNGNVLGEYYVISNSNTLGFTYYKDNGSGGLTALNSVASPTVPTCALGEISAVEVDIEFLVGPKRGTEGFAADAPSTLHTMIYISNPVNSSSTTTSTTCPE